MHLGIDLGTSGVKAVLVDDRQEIVGSAAAPLSVSRPQPDWSEQDPGDWIAAFEAVLDGLARDFRPALAAVRGVGLSGQMHGATALDAADAPLRPCILWNDGRSADQAARLDRDPQFRALTGNIVFPGFTAPKMLWMREHEPALHARIQKVLLPKDFLRLWLTGESVSDMSDAAGTSWLETGARRWSEALLDASGARLDQMPRLVEGAAPSGRLRPELAARWGLSDGVVVAGGAGDNAASAIGLGVVGDGDGFVSLGTSGVLFVATSGYRPAPESAVHSFCHAVPKRWHQMGVMLSAAASLDWFARVVGAPPAELVAALGDELAPPGAALFLPYLSGERTPYNDAAARGAFVQLSHDADRAALTHAVLAGVAFALRDNLEALRAAGTEASRLLCVGGGARSPYWLKMIATALARPIDVPAAGAVGAAFGAARLGMAAAGGDPGILSARPAVAATFDPEASLLDAYDDAYRRHRAGYPALSRLS